MPRNDKSTKERILDAAEGLFADRGFGGTSLRSITAAAEVNLAAVNYHFGSKEALFDAVLARRLEPLNRERLALLDAAEASAGTATPPLERILDAFVGPPLRLHRDAERGGSMFIRLVGRTMTEPSPHVQEIFISQFREIAGRFSAALRRALPGIPPREIYWRMHFAIGAMAHTMCDTNRLKLISGGLCDPADDVEATIRRLVQFACAGLGAPAPPAAREKRS